MTPAPADLESRVTALERRQRRTDEDMKVLIDTVVETQEDVKALRLEVGDVKLDVRELKQDVGGLKQDVGGLKQDMGGLKQDIGGLKQDMGWLKRGMHLLLAHQGLAVEREDVDGRADD